MIYVKALFNSRKLNTVIILKVLKEGNCSTLVFFFFFLFFAVKDFLSQHAVQMFIPLVATSLKCNVHVTDDINTITGNHIVWFLYLQFIPTNWMVL